MIEELRKGLNQHYRADQYGELQRHLEERCGGPVGFRIAETPVFLPLSLLDEIAATGARLCQRLVEDAEYLAQARQAIPAGYRVAGETARPHFLTADFALVRAEGGELEPRLVEMQAFPSVYAYQAALSDAYRDAYQLEQTVGARLGQYLSGLDEAGYWEGMRQTIVGGHDPETVVLCEVDPFHQKTLPDFVLTAQRLGIGIADIAQIEPEGNRLTYCNSAGRRIPITRIYNRAIADELMARGIKPGFDLEQQWDVEWAGHPNWYFLVSKFSIPYLSRPKDGVAERAVPPSVFLSDFLAGPGRRHLESAGVKLPSPAGGAIHSNLTYSNLILKPLFSFAGKGIEFDPTQERLEAIPEAQRGDYLLQERMSFVPTIATPHGPTQAEIRILYLWPDGGSLTPVNSLVRLGRGRMMGVDHNRNQEWVGASAAFFPLAE